MSNRDRLLRAIEENVAEIIDRGQDIAVTDLALKLSSTFQQSGMPISEICAEIEAVWKRANGNRGRPDISG